MYKWCPCALWIFIIFLNSEIWKSYLFTYLFIIFRELETHECLEKMIRSLTVPDCLFIWKLSTVWLTQPCGTIVWDSQYSAIPYCELVWGLRLGFSVQEAHWEDRGRIRAKSPVQVGERLYTHDVWPQRLVVYVWMESFPPVHPPYISMCIQERRK